MERAGGQKRLLGRADECAALNDVISTARSGTGRALVLRGEAGVGKTALLEYLREQGKGFRSTGVVGVESDMELAFAGLQQLCAPLLAHVDELPGPQREALEVAFGRRAGVPPDRFLVGLAVLSLMAVAASRRPLLCVLDDVQWLDQVSVQTLAFVGRRLVAEPVALVFAARDDGAADALTGLPELVIGNLADAGAGELLDSIVLSRLDEPVRDRILAETRGNPLALLELPRNLIEAELASGFRETAPHPVSGRVAQTFTRRIQMLPNDTQRLLLIAAAEPVGDTALFIRAANRLGISADALEPAEAAGLIEFGWRLRFRHPLVRTAVYRGAELADRREIHRALAEVTDPLSDPDRRAWHAAHACAGPDDDVATQLEASASRAQRRGGAAAAAAFLERATTLTCDPARRGGRALNAARAKHDAAAPTAAYALLATAELGPLTALERAQATRLRAQMDFARSRGGDAHAPMLGVSAARLLDAADRLNGLDGDLALEAHLEALAASLYAGRLGEPDAVTKAAVAASAAAQRIPDSKHPVAPLLRGLATLVSNRAQADIQRLRTALDLLHAEALRDGGQALRWMSLGLVIIQECAAMELWDDTQWWQLATDMVNGAREAGALAVLAPALVYRAGVHQQAGEFTMATELVAEADSLTAATGYAPVRYHSLALAAWRGAPVEAISLNDAARADGVARGEGRVLGLTGLVSAVLYNGLGRYGEAFTAARKACEYEDFGFFGWTLIELIEAASRTGEQAAGAWALRLLEERAGTSGTDWGLAAIAGSRALLAGNDSADALYLEAIQHWQRTRIVAHLARTRLCYGEWLRRVDRRVDARTQLRQAHDMLSGMGANAFAERARRELIATGEKVRKQPVSAGDRLTAQEGQVARLARDGLTNQEIGAQLFLSTHTVEYHLKKIFIKLGISSRKQLRTSPALG